MTRQRRTKPVPKQHAPRLVLVCRDAPTEKLLRACALLGVGVRRGREAPPEPESGAVEAIRTLAPGMCCLVLGSSGAGKTTLLRWAAAHAPNAVHVNGARLLRMRSAAIDTVPGDAGAALRALSRAGLADGLLLARRPGELSEGERWRLALAHGFAACAEAPGSGLLCADEFASTLDRDSARRICLLARRAAAALRIRLLLATAHDDVNAWLKPDVLVTCLPGKPARIRIRRSAP